MIMGMAAFCMDMMAEEVIDTTKVKKLDEVVVEGNLPYIVNNGSKTTIRVQGSPYSKTGSVREMLGSLPGLYDDGSGIKVVGVGTPMFIVDGREVADIGQLSAMSASQVKEISIDYAPGADYSAGTQVLVMIVSKKSLDDYLYLEVSNRIMVRRKVSDNPMLDFKIQSGRLKMSLLYDFETFGNVNKETYFRAIAHDSYDFRLDQHRKIPTRDFIHKISWSGEYDINRYGRIGLYYYYSDTYGKGWESGSNEIVSDKRLYSFDFSQHSITDARVHNVTAVYDFDRDATLVNLTQDFAWRDTEYKDCFDEGFGAISGKISNIADKKYWLSTTSLKIGFALPGSINMECGSKLNYVSSRTWADMQNSGGSEKAASNKITLSELNPQVYFQLNRRFGNVSVRPGLRYEYMHRSIDNFNYVSKKNSIVKSIRSGFYPFLMLRYSGNPFRGWIQYSRSVVNPDFSIFNSGEAYLDFMSFRVDNPNIKATVKNEVWGRVDFKKLGLSFSYRHHKNFITGIEELRFPDKNIVNSSYINIPWRQVWGLSLTYSSRWKGLSYFAIAGMYVPLSKIPVGDGYLIRRSVGATVNANISYKINDKFSVFTYVFYQGRDCDVFRTQKSACNWSLGAKASLLDDKLSISLTISDILKKANYNNMEYDYMNSVVSGTCGTNDMRGVSLNISYTIFNKSINMNTRPGNDDILKRTN